MASGDTHILYIVGALVLRGRPQTGHVGDRDEIGSHHKGPPWSRRGRTALFHHSMPSRTSENAPEFQYSQSSIRPVLKNWADAVFDYDAPRTNSSDVGY